MFIVSVFSRSTLIAIAAMCVRLCVILKVVLICAVLLRVTIRVVVISKVKLIMVVIAIDRIVDTNIGSTSNGTRDIEDVMTSNIKI